MKNKAIDIPKEEGIMVGCEKCGKFMIPIKREKACHLDHEHIYAVFETITFKCFRCEILVQTWNRNKPLGEENVSGGNN